MSGHIRLNRKIVPRNAVAGVLLAGLLSAACAPTSHPLLGAKAPNIELALLDGGRMDLAHHLGKDIVILDFWATWCSPCRKTMPILEQIANNYKDKGVVLYAISSGEDPRTIRQFLDAEGLGPTVALDPHFQAAWAYQVDFIPQTVLIDKQGVIQSVRVGAGYNFGPQLTKDLDTLLAGQGLLASPPKEE